MVDTTVRERLSEFVLDMEEITEKVSELLRRFEKGAIEEDKLMIEWHRNLAYLQFMSRRHKAYIGREQIYIKKKTKQHSLSR